MFEKSLQDVVKGIRASKRDTALYISQCIAEIKDEINSKDMFIKTHALQKLTFLHMMGYSMSWASFATIEVMSSPRFAQKRIGYLAASQGFTQGTDVILLSTNLLKKELRVASNGGTGVYECGLAINCLSNIVTEELAQDLLPELTNLTSHSVPYMRKKALLCLFKVFIKYPQGLRLTFDKIQQCLNDPNPAVVSCAVNVITELSQANPRNYLHLAPAFFNLLTNSNNNWMLIKVVKLLGSLVPEEPRLARKLLEPLAGIVRSTPAKSLLFEAAHAASICMPYCRKSDGSMPSNAPVVVELCAQTFRDFVEEKDQNLKYLGLVGFGSLILSSPKILSTNNYRPLILACLSDDDVTIRSRALDLLPSMASRKNLVELVKQLLRHVAFASGTYKLNLVEKIIIMCSGEKYALLQDFHWYLDTLFHLGRMRGLDIHAELLRSQVCDVALRVLPVRAYAVKRSVDVLLESKFDLDGKNDNNKTSDPSNFGDNGRGKHIMPEILPTLAWITGEYSDLLPEAMTMDSDAIYIYNDDSEGPYHSILQALMEPTNSNKLPASTLSVYIQASLKVFAATCTNPQVSDSEMEACVKTVSRNLVVYMEHPNVEVCERAVTLNSLLVALNLIPENQGSGAPGLTILHNSDEDNEDNRNGPLVLEGNLLDMPIASMKGNMAKIKHNPSPSLVVPSGLSLASRCRNASSALSYLLKPYPMKPTGTKAQRKKHQNPVGIGVDSNDPVDTSVFSIWIEEEKGHRHSSRLSLEAVSFTLQRPVVSKSASGIATDAVSSFDEPLPGQRCATDYNSNNKTFQETSDSQVSSQFVDAQNFKNTPGRHANDPFYLSSMPNATDIKDPGSTDGNIANTFGNIQILLGDDEEIEDAPSKKKKKKKDKKHKTSAQASMDNLGQRFGNIAIYESEDDDGDVGLHPITKIERKKKESVLNGLAKVDLSTPLREDEVFLERKHRVVPERRVIPEPTSVQSKKKKKSSKKKKKESNQRLTDVPSNAFDLLDLNSPMPKVHQSQQITSSASILQSQSVMDSQTNNINNSFDDLLGLTDAFQQPLTTTSKNAGSDFPGMSNHKRNAQAKTSSEKKAYLRATIKTSSALGSPSVDWSKVDLLFRVSRLKGERAMAVSLAVCVQNNMISSGLNGLVLQLNNYGEIPIGNIASQSSLESSKIGPFSYPALDVALELKGKLATQDSSVTIKVVLPISVHISPPDKGLTMDQVASELASSQWASHSTRITHNSSIAPEKIKQKICTYLNMVEIESSDPSFGTLAGRSSTGVPLRLLIKVRANDVKVDIKSGNVPLGRALSSELKKLIL